MWVLQPNSVNQSDFAPSPLATISLRTAAACLNVHFVPSSAVFGERLAMPMYGWVAITSK